MGKLQKINELKQIITCAVSLFIKYDQDLLALSAHEQAISHRIALYLEPYFKDLNVDCEYNKYLEKTKKIIIEEEKIDIFEAKRCGCSSCVSIFSKESKISSEKLRIFRPDIIVHKRNTDNNIIVIEIKTAKNCPFDKAKLRAFTIKNSSEQEYKYEYMLGVCLYFPNNIPTYNWCIDGIFQ